MKTLNVSLSDLIENDELVSLLRSRILGGALTKNEILRMLECIPDAKKPSANQGSTTCKLLHFAKHGITGIEYALNGGEVIGPVVKDRQIRYVLALKNIATNLNIDEARRLADRQECICGINWIIPNDDHFRALQVNLSKVNRFLEAYGGDKIGSTPFLSATSQSNPPRTWNVRFILPLPAEI
ncbi:MAG: hypothetical protein IJ677_02695 [Alphaproteobacteria bacterium]|nr:hypothetical protein [Alphaproteobacteria bacterium]